MLLLFGILTKSSEAIHLMALNGNREYSWIINLIPVKYEF